MRVVVTQFATCSDVRENLATCIRLIDKAAVCNPSIIILPEFCNTSPWYVDQNEAWNNALSIDGDFLQKISEHAIKYNCYIALNVTIRRDDSRDHNNNDLKSNISVTTCLFSPCGELIYQEDKQQLTEHEKTFFVHGNDASEIIPSDIGNLGFMLGDDSMTFAKARKLKLKGASLLCNTIHTSALDQCTFHDPTRACENRVFVASANKIGKLLTNDKYDVNSNNYLLSNHQQTGVGQSQIVSPEGKVLAKLDHNEEGFVFADIDLSSLEKEDNSKFRPDGTDLVKQRRPELYQTVSESTQSCDNNLVPATTNVAIFATYKSNEQAIEDVCHYIINNLSDIIQLPELFFIDDKNIINDIEQRSLLESLSQQLIRQISLELRPFQYVCTSLIIEGEHRAVIISKNGLFAIQPQLHFCQRYQWTEIGDQLNIVELPLEQGIIKVAMLTADDANIPEVVECAALNNIHVLLVPFDIQEANEAEFCLVSRAIEHRICIVAATREKSFSSEFKHDRNVAKTHKSTGIIVNITTDSELLSQWKTSKSNGYISQPFIKYQHGKITKAVIHPIAADSK
jgi:predicted amidohydrolase